MKKYIVTLLTSFIVVTGIFGQGTQEEYYFPYGTGLKEDIAAEEEIPVKVRAKRKGNLPPQFSIKAYCPKVGHQRNAPSCTGWAIGYAYMTISEAIAKGVSRQKNIQNLRMSPTFAYDQLTGPEGKLCQASVRIPDILKFYKEKGNVKFDDYDIRCGQYTPPSEEILEKAKQFRIHEYLRLWNRGASPKDKVEKVKELLVEKKPVLIQIKGFQTIGKDNFKPLKNGGKLWKSSREDHYAGAHAMIVVGYNDEFKAFELMNSFGAGFGKDGYVWLSYKDFQDKCNMAYDVIYRDPEVQYSQQVEAFQDEKGIPNNSWTVTTNFYKVGRNRNGIYRVPMPIDFQTTSNTYLGSDTYISQKTVFQIDVHTSRQQYFYVFSFDETETTKVQFPFTEEYKEVNGIAKGGKVVPLSNVQEEVYTLPHKDYGIQFDEQSGIDYYCILFSLKELSISEIQHAIEMGNGTIQQRIQQVLYDQLIPTNSIEYFSDDIGFKVVGNIEDKTIVPIIIGLRHNL